MFDNLNQLHKNHKQTSKAPHAVDFDVNKNINLLSQKSGVSHKKIKSLHKNKFSSKEMHIPNNQSSNPKGHLPSFLLKCKAFFNKKKTVKATISKQHKLIAKVPQHNLKDQLFNPVFQKSAPAQSKVATTPSPIVSAGSSVATPTSNQQVPTESVDMKVKSEIKKVLASSSNKTILTADIKTPTITPVAPPTNIQFHKANTTHDKASDENELEVNLLPLYKKHFSSHQIFVSYFVTIVIGLLITITPYTYFLSNNKIFASTITSLQAQVNSINEKNKEFNNKVISMKPFSIKLQSLLPLLENHIYWSKFFPLLERYTVGNVYYTALNVDGDTVSITGAALNLRALAEQLVVFQQNKIFLNVILENFSFVEATTSNDPTINFSFSFTLDKTVIIQPNSKK